MTSPAAHQTLRLLQHLASQRGPVAASTLASVLGLPRSTVYRLLGVLEKHGFVLHFAELQRYGIGLAAFELSSGFSRQEPLSRLGRPLLAALVDEVGESAHLAVLHGRDVIYLVEERAPRRPSLVTDVGVRLPSHLTASGRALLAALPAAQVRALYPGPEAFAARLGAEEPTPGRTPGGSTVDVWTYPRLRHLLTQAQQQGFAREDGDVTGGMASVAVAVLDHAGWPAAAIAVTFAHDVGGPAQSGHDRADQAERLVAQSAVLAARIRPYAARLARGIHGRDAAR